MNREEAIDILARNFAWLAYEGLAEVAWENHFSDLSESDFGAICSKIEELLPASPRFASGESLYNKAYQLLAERANDK